MTDDSVLIRANNSHPHTSTTHFAQTILLLLPISNHFRSLEVASLISHSAMSQPRPADGRLDARCLVELLHGAVHMRTGGHGPRAGPGLHVQVVLAQLQTEPAAASPLTPL